MVHVDGVSLEDVVVIHCGRINALVEFAGVEWGVVKVADGEGYGICGRGQEAAAPAHKVLSQGDLCVETEVEASAPVPAAGVLPPRLPRELRASAKVRSSLLDIVFGVVA